ncbi:MAG: tRNA (cytidine(56)-2'-O)-methyltransferase [Candidatus Altiarchaeota archaeon]|nr:tRNA (cytidine(56)-2'-O)-methyltransferase [Candidatus Altiarchaeota archaeon]
MISVMRYGHRIGRDKRTTTHVGLVARAFGADEFVLVGMDSTPLKTLENVVDNWGGDFRAIRIKNWRKFLRDFSGVKIHLTMYGLPLNKILSKIKADYTKSKNLLVFVGAEKVPPEVYELCDYNVAVGNQPHSEIAALAVFLDHFVDAQSIGFDGAVLRVEPQARGKKVVKL